MYVAPFNGLETWRHINIFFFLLLLLYCRPLLQTIEKHLAFQLSGVPYVTAKIDCCYGECINIMCWRVIYCNAVPSLPAALYRVN